MITEGFRLHNVMFYLWFCPYHNHDQYYNHRDVDSTIINIPSRVCIFLPLASHSVEIALAGSRRLRSTLVAALVLFAYTVVTSYQNEAVVVVSGIPVDDALPALSSMDQLEVLSACDIQLCVDVLDADRFSKDMFLGTVTFPAHKLPVSVPVTKWLPLAKRSQKDKVGPFTLNCTLSQCADTYQHPFR